MISIILVPLVPILALITPGIFIVRHHHKSPWHFLAMSAIWSVTINSLLAFLGFLLQIPAGAILFILILLNIILLPPFIRRLKTRPRSIFYLTSSLVILFFTFLLLSIPYIYLHDALPTGDSQKAVFWGQQILSTNALPDYSLAASRLNRDPQDFFTPALHSLTALTMKATPYPLITVGFLAIAASILTAVIGSAIAQTIASPKQSMPIGIFTFLLVLTQIRFLRYLREPGYHFQNVFGELLLFGLIFLILTFIRHRRPKYLFLILLTLATLFLTHQFSTFIAAFTLLPIIIFLIIYTRRHILSFLNRHQYFTAFLILLVIIAGLSLWQLNLLSKLPHIFTSNPHLLNLTPALSDYPRLMGLTWIILGLSGLILMLARPPKSFNLPQLIFIIFTIFLLILSQAPRLSIDIPPVRALFYSAIPLSIFAAYFLTRLIARAKNLPPSSKLLARLTIAAVIIIALTTGTSSAFNLSHTVRTNSTFLPAYQNLIDYLNQRPDSSALLTDDYNRRGSSWLLLSRRPMLTRISGNLERQMNEANQSPARRTLYLQQLDFEKIFSLGSRPEVEQLLNKYNIGYLTGIAESSAASFKHNPLLTEVNRAGDIILYQVKSDNNPAETLSPLSEDIISWLLKPTTLVNDIGDAEDTFKHLPISLPSTRLSDPIINDRQTSRATTAPLIPIKINVGDYISLLIDQDNNNFTDISLQLLLVTDQVQLNILTGTGTAYTYDSANPLLRIKSTTAPIDSQGFITIYIDNPNQQLINIDLIAVGLSSIP